MSRLLVLLFTVVAVFVLPIPLTQEIIMPVPEVKAAEPAFFPTAQQSLPARVTIPAIQLNSRIMHMGITSDGELDVPSGKTNHVGWYAGGTLPGEVGSAVLDAHVYAAFKNLRKVKVGQDIYVTMDNGTPLHFKITEKKTLPLSQISSDEFFNRATGKELHLITCAGTFNKKINTYTHRLLVYATLVE